MKFLIYILSALFCFTFSTCKKTTRDPTDTYFDCKLNGATYEPDNCVNCLQCTYIGDTTFALAANNGFEILSVGIANDTGIRTGTYPLNEMLQDRGGYRNTTGVSDWYYTDATHTGQLTLTKIDKTNKLIEGSFYFKAYNAFRQDSITASCRFQLQYYY